MNHARKRKVENAKGDGNCAFNAFVLGLVDPSVLNHIKPLADNSDFVTRACVPLNIVPVSWNALKAYLLSNNTPAFRMRLQETLSPILRKIAIESIVANVKAKEDHLDLTTPAIQAELHAYFNARRSAKANDQVNLRAVGDIFIRHPFIKNKFEELFAASPDIRVAQASLVTWWETLGHNAFLARMAQPAKSAGSIDLYAGELELAPLGAYFGVNIRVKSSARHIDIKINSVNGVLPVEFAADMRNLASRGIIENDLKGTWIDLPEDELRARLSAVPQFDELMQYVQRDKPLRGDSLPAKFGFDCLIQLGARGIVAPSGQFAIPPTEELLIERATEMDSKDRVIQAWKNTYHVAPVVALQNQHAAHWDNLQPEASLPQPQLNTAKPNPIIKPNISKPNTAATTKNKGGLHPKLKNTSISISSTASATTTLAPVALQYTSTEREVHHAVNEVFDYLDALRPKTPPVDPRIDDQIKQTFEGAYAKFIPVLGMFKDKPVDQSFLDAKQAILDEVKLEAQKI